MHQIQIDYDHNFGICAEQLKEIDREWRNAFSIVHFHTGFDVERGFMTF